MEAGSTHNELILVSLRKEFLQSLQERKNGQTLKSCRGCRGYDLERGKYHQGYLADVQSHVKIL